MSLTNDCRPTPAAASPRPAGVDARRHRRARAHWPVRPIAAGDAIVSCRICDVSEGGFGVFGPANLPTGALVRAVFAVPQPFCGTQSRLGVQFLALSMETRLAIRTYTIANS